MACSTWKSAFAGMPVISEILPAILRDFAFWRINASTLAGVIPRSAATSSTVAPLAARAEYIFSACAWRRARRMQLFCKRRYLPSGNNASIGRPVSAAMCSATGSELQPPPMTVKKYTGETPMASANERAVYPWDFSKERMRSFMVSLLIALSSGAGVGVGSDPTTSGFVTAVNRSARRAAFAMDVRSDSAAISFVTRLNLIRSTMRNRAWSSDHSSRLMVSGSFFWMLSKMRLALTAISASVSQPSLSLSRLERTLRLNSCPGFMQPCLHTGPAISPRQACR